MPNHGDAETQTTPPRRGIKPAKPAMTEHATAVDENSPVKFSETALRSGKRIALYLGDCLKGMEQLLGPDSVDVIVTSPPYNIGVQYGQYNDRIPREAYLKWIGRWGELVRLVLKPCGSLFLNIGSKPSDPWVPFDVAGRFRDTLVLQNVFHWIKSIYVENESYGETIRLNVGHFKPINSKRFVTDTHEYVFHFTRSGNVELDRLAVGVPYKDTSNIARWKSSGSGVRCRGNSWYIPYDTIQRRASERPHPASFPPELAHMCIELQGRAKVDRVLDPFLGIGNTAVACARLGVEMVGFDIDEEYLRVADAMVKDAARKASSPETPDLCQLTLE
ncbi:MAG: site-specific DNA-methyltransferase [Thermodesulfobacteriota bacterium]